MITFDELLARAHTIDTDASVYDSCSRKHIDITIEDFAGFNSDWEEEFREYEDPDAVEDFLTWLEENADSIDNNLYTYYHFGDICVQIGYASFDI